MEISSAVPAEVAHRIYQNANAWTEAQEAAYEAALESALKSLVDDLMTFGQYPYNAQSQRDRKADLAEWIADNMDGFDAALALAAHIKGDIEAAEDCDNRLRSMLMDHYRDSELVREIAREEA